MENINLPTEIINHIKGFIPRDRDMKHPVGEIINEQICLFEYNLEKRGGFYEYLYPCGMSFIRFMSFCRTTGYPEIRTFHQVHKIYGERDMDDIRYYMDHLDIESDN